MIRIEYLKLRLRVPIRSNESYLIATGYFAKIASILAQNKVGVMCFFCNVLFRGLERVGTDQDAQYLQEWSVMVLAT
jgi:hypothetical protein